MHKKTSGPSLRFNGRRSSRFFVKKKALTCSSATPHSLSYAYGAYIAMGIAMSVLSGLVRRNIMIFIFFAMRLCRGILMLCASIGSISIGGRYFRSMRAICKETIDLLRYYHLPVVSKRLWVTYGRFSAMKNNPSRCEEKFFILSYIAQPPLRGRRRQRAEEEEKKRRKGG